MPKTAPPINTRFKAIAARVGYLTRNDSIFELRASARIVPLCIGYGITMEDLRDNNIYTIEESAAAIDAATLEGGEHYLTWLKWCSAFQWAEGEVSRGYKEKIPCFVEHYRAAVRWRKQTGQTLWRTGVFANLDSLFSEDQVHMRINQIIEACCEICHCTRACIASKGRHPSVVACRCLITVAAKTFTSMSYPEISKAIGTANHSTVITSHQVFSFRVTREDVLPEWGYQLTGSEMLELWRRLVLALGMPPKTKPKLSNCITHGAMICAQRNRFDTPVPAKRESLLPAEPERIGSHWRGGRGLPASGGTGLPGRAFDGAGRNQGSCVPA